MSDLRKAAEQALEALEEINKLSIGENAICLPAEIDCAIEALGQALAQPKREWVGLTEKEIIEIIEVDDNVESIGEFALAIEAKLKEKNA